MELSLREIRSAVESVCNEKGVGELVVQEAIEIALATATKRKADGKGEYRVAIDWEANSYDTFRRWRVVDPESLQGLVDPSDGETDTLEESEPEEELRFDKEAHLSPESARELDPDLGLGDFWEERVPSVGFGRIEAQTARQVITQRVRAAERERVIRQYTPYIGTLVNGTVKKTGRDTVIVDLGSNAEGLLTREHLIPKESFRVNDRLKALLLGMNPENRGPQLILSRTVPEMLIELFKLEVPEVGEFVIEIKAAARDPGQRAKIAVTTNDGRIDAVGACVGMRGSRVQAVSGELDGERVDVILWDPNPAQLAINAMSPAEVEEIVLDEDLKSMDIAVDNENLAQAIGKNGQNVRLASELTGWALNIMDREDALKSREEEIQRCIDRFMEDLSVDEEVATILAEEGFTSLEEVAYVPEAEMLAIEGFDEGLVEELRTRAKAAQELKRITGQLAGAARPADDLINMKGMDAVLANRLAANDVVTMEDLAEQSIPDLLDIDESIGEERAGQLIMTAREPWFSESQESDD